MSEGKELILSTKPFAHEIRWKSWYYTLSTLLLLLGGIYLTTQPIPFYFRIPASIFTGLMMGRFFVIYHDHQHHSILYHSWIATAIFTVFGIYIMAPTSIWKRSHDYHHNHNSKLFSASIGSYPIMTKQKFMEATKGEQRLYLATRHPITIALGYISMFMIGMALQSFMSAKKRHFDSLIAIIIHLIGCGLMIYFFGWMMWIYVIGIPFGLACALGAYLFYAQHNFPGVTFKEKDDWRYEYAALYSSSYMVMNPFMNWCTANIGYHHIHHLNSRIPFYRLPEAMAAIPELQHPVQTSLKIKDIRACFKLKVWDSELNAMTAI